MVNGDEGCEFGFVFTIKALRKNAPLSFIKNFSLRAIKKFLNDPLVYFLNVPCRSFGTALMVKSISSPMAYINSPAQSAGTLPKVFSPVHQPPGEAPFPLNPLR